MSVGYVVTDIETDSPWPGRIAMRSFASVAITMAGEQLGTSHPTPARTPDDR